MKIFNLNSGRMISLLLILSFSFVIGQEKERELTISVQPGAKECFYIEVHSGQTLDIDYQVIDGGQGELDLDFQLISPSRRLIVSETRKSDGTHRQTMDETGDYEACFDNSFSIYSAKSVFFEILIENDQDESKEIWGEFDIPDMLPEEMQDIAFKGIQDYLTKVRDNLVRTERFQNDLRALEARDRNVAEASFARVNWWSSVFILAVICSSTLQVFLVRSFFDEQSRIHGLWKRGHL
ncbi:transmembrane emp24 domain-containing protein 1-like [Artemia franciscana]